MNMHYWTEVELYPNFDVVYQIPGSFYNNRFYHGDCPWKTLLVP